MNTFDLTQEEERHWQIMQDGETFVEDVRRERSDDKRMSQFSAAHISAESQRRLHFLRQQKKGESKFYSLGGTARNLRRGHSDEEARSVGNLTSEIEKACLDDPELIRMLYTLHGMMIDSEKEKRTSSGVSFEKLIGVSDSFIEGAVQAKFDYHDTADTAMAKHSQAQIYFQNFLEELVIKIDKYGAILSTHQLFRDIEHVKSQVLAVRELCVDSKLNTSDSGHLTMELPEKFASDFDEQLHSIDTGVHNPFVAKGVFLHKLGLVPHIKYFLTVANIIAYAERVAEKDSEVDGVFPELCDPEEGALVLDVEEFSHPAIYRGKPLKNHFQDTYNTLGHGIFMRMQEAGLIGLHNDERGKSDFYWCQGVTSADVERFIQENDIKPSPAENIAMLFSRASFVPFQDIHLNARQRIQIVTGANFNGKSTYMQAIGYLFHKAATARKFIAKQARLSLPDMVFDDFDINSRRQHDIASEKSTFSSQVGKVIEFMDRGTPRSIGLFDELYHGTSAPYLLSLGWATIEKFEELGLYAIISTHEPLLTRYTEENGYDSLRGKYYRPPHQASTQRSTAVSNVSMQGVYELKHEPVIDSDAFRIARQEGMSEEVMARAQNILKHITATPE